jgi:hypothetical protein
LFIWINRANYQRGRSLHIASAECEVLKADNDWVPDERPKWPPLTSYEDKAIADAVARAIQAGQSPQLNQALHYQNFR